MTGRYPDWAALGPGWPNRDASRFVPMGARRWHVQRAGAGPVLLLLHGTGAATHSWRGLLPLLAPHFDVIAPDLPAHGFTAPDFSRPLSLPGMAADVGALLDALGVVPDVIAGHSAGAAVAVQLLHDRGWRAPLVGFAPALTPFPGLAARLFPQLARMLFTNPVVSIILSRMARTRGEADRFLRRATGSAIDAAGVGQYQTLFSHSGHVDGALRMMAGWQLEPLQAVMAGLTSPVLLVHGERDSAIPRSATDRAAATLPRADLTIMAGLGHLAHEEDPAAAARIIRDFAAAHGVGAV